MDAVDVILKACGRDDRFTLWLTLKRLNEGKDENIWKSVFILSSFIGLAKWIYRQKGLELPENLFELLWNRMLYYHEAKCRTCGWTWITENNLGFWFNPKRKKYTADEMKPFDLVCPKCRDQFRLIKG